VYSICNKTDCSSQPDNVSLPFLQPLSLQLDSHSFLCNSSNTHSSAAIGVTAWFQASAAVQTRSSLVVDITLHRLITIGVSRQPICPILKGQESKKNDCPETSAVNYQSTLCNIPEERRSHGCFTFNNRIHFLSRQQNSISGITKVSRNLDTALGLSFSLCNCLQILNS
jgi:hypothetical protein